MDDIRVMLNFDVPCVQRKAVHKLLQQIGRQLKPGEPPLLAETAKGGLPREVELLVEQCGEQAECCEALVSLVVSGQLEWRYALGQLLGAGTAATRHPSGAVAAVGRLLTLHMQGELQAGPYHCPFALRSHPLVLVLRERPDCWDAVLQAAQEALHTCSGQEEALVELLRPLLAHCLAGPSQPAEHASLRLWLWLALAQHWPRWLRALLPWMPLCEGDVRWQLLVMEQLLPRVEPPLDGPCSLQALAACLLALDARLSCGGVLRALLSCLRTKNEQRVSSGDEQLVWDACLVLAAVLLARAPGSGLADILDLCEALLERRDWRGVGRCLVLPLCLLVQQQQLLPRGLQGRAAALLGRLAADSEPATPLEEKTTSSAVTLASSHPLVAGALFAATCLRGSSSPQECVERWWSLRGVLPSQERALLGMLVSSAALLGSRTPADARVALGTLRQEVDASTQLAPCVLPLLLHMLGRSRCPQTLALVLRSLADTADHKYALGPLWSGVRALSGHHPSLAALCLPSLATLCVRQPLLLPVLFQALGGDDVASKGDDLVLAKAQAIGILLEHSASQHGANLLRPLVTLVTSCRGDRQGAAVVLALRCLHQLCAAEVVNVKTTLSSVVPKLWKDDRPLVVRAVCELMAVVPAVSVPTVEYERYEQETAGRLWRLAVAPEGHPTVRGGAFRALAAFPPSCHSLKHLPPEAKVNLKMPASKTPLDLGRSPEELLTYTPGHCFLDLLATIDDEQVMHDYGQLLSSLVRHEVSQLPRSVYTAPRAAAAASSGGGEAAAGMGAQLSALYEANRFPAIQGSLALGILLTYEPTQPTAGARAKPASSLYKAYLHQLPSLLQDVPLDGADWARCLSVAPAWGAWVRRAFRAAEEHRRRELKDDPQAEATSCLWARDTLTEAIKSNCSGRASQQGNALLALGALLEATAEHLQGLDTGARRQAAKSHTAWAHALLDLVVECCGLPPPSTQARQGGDQEHFQWLLKASSGMLVRGCAAAAAGGLVGLLHRRDPHCVRPLLEVLAARLQAAEGGPTGQALTGAGLAACVAAATRLGLVDTTSSAQDGSVRCVVLRVVEELMSACLQNSMCEPKAGQLLCLALCLCSLGRVPRGDEAVRQMVIDGCTRFCQDLHAADPDACSFEVRCVCTSLAVCSAAQGLLSLSNVEELLLWFEKRRQEDPQCQGTALAVGLLVRTLVERAHPKGPLLWASLLPHWTDTLLSQNQPTLSRLAALRGLCVMLGASGPLLVSTEAADAEEAAGTKQRSTERRQMQEQLLRLLSRSSARDVALASCAAWALGHLSGGSAHGRGTAASVPSSYSYLGDASVLRSLVDFLATSIKAGSWNGRVGACLSSLDQDFGRALPPLNWTALLAPVLRECPPDLPDLVVGVALRGAPSSPPMATLLGACAAPPLLHSLPGTCVERLLRGLPVVVRSTPSSRLGPFLELAAARVLQPGGLPILQGVESLLGDEGSELAPGARGAICDLLAAVAQGCQEDVWGAQQRGLLPVLGRCATRLTGDALGALLDALEALPLLLALHCHLVAAGKAPPGCDTFAMASNLVDTSDEDHCQEEERVLWLLSQCLRLPEPGAEEGGRQVRWFVDCLVATKETALRQDHQLLRFQLRVLSLIGVVLSRTQPLPVRPLSAAGQLASDLWLLLPESLATLLLSTQPSWRDITAMVLERLSEMVALEVPSDVRHLLLSCACRLRSTPEFGSAFTQLLAGLRA